MLKNGFSHRFLRKKKILHKLPQVLEDYFFPPVLYVDVARQLFAHKHWTVLGHLVSHWPFRSFSLSQIFCVNCPNCWSAYLESEDVEDSEREGGDTERQLLRKVFKHVLDGFFLVVKKKFNSGHSTPLRVLDLTLDPSQHVRGFMWEEEFRRLSRRYLHGNSRLKSKGIDSFPQNQVSDLVSILETTIINPIMNRPSFVRIDHLLRELCFLPQELVLSDAIYTLLQKRQVS